MELFRFSRLFDPTEVCFFSRVLDEHNLPTNFYESIKDEWLIYLNIVETENIDLTKFNLEKWWLNHKCRLPKMFEIARWLVKMPSSSCDSERALSKYKLILADNRQNMSETIRMSNFLYFNTNKDHILSSLPDNINNDLLEDDIVPIDDVSEKEN